MSGFWRVSILIYVVTSASAQQNAGNLYCPMTWAEGQQVTLEFHIDESLFPSQCTGSTDNKPYFQRSLTSTGTPTTFCRTADITTSNACTTSFSAGSLGCGCIVRNGSYVLQYNFMPNTSHNGWWSASVQCSDAFATQMLTFTATQCDNIKVQGSQKTVDNPDDNKTEKIAGGTVGAAAGAGSVTAVVLAILYANRSVVYSTKKITDKQLEDIRKTGAKVERKTITDSDRKTFKEQLKSFGEPDADTKKLEAIIEVSWTSPRTKEMAQEKVQELIKRIGGHYYSRNGETNFEKKEKTPNVQKV